jgi:hypothetical protein
MLDNTVNQVYFFFAGKENQVLLGDIETKTAISECELYISKKFISLDFKQAPYELCNLYRTKVV